MNFESNMWQTWLFLTLTALCWGIAPILEKYGLKDTDEFAAVAVRSFAIFFVLLAIFVFTGKMQTIFTFPLKKIIIFSLSGLLAGLLGMWTYFKALKMSPSSKIVPLVATYPLITVILSVFLLKEEVSWQRILGTILIILGVLLVK
ncbi:MAG: EamA family transporter [Candidatus Omnitrophota bacterium]|nr:MAG: EamA family transporter [Candidatus Omnitrophota bacterium]